MSGIGQTHVGRERRRYAVAAVRQALKRGELSHDVPCESCGAEGCDINLHHYSYTKNRALDVIPLCDPCHRQVHTGRRMEPRTRRIYKQSSKSPITISEVLEHVGVDAEWLSVETAIDLDTIGRYIDGAAPTLHHAVDICLATGLSDKNAGRLLLVFGAIREPKP